MYNKVTKRDKEMKSKFHVKPCSWIHDGCDVYRCLWDTYSSYGTDKFITNVKHIEDVHKVVKYERLQDDTFLIWQNYSYIQ